MFFFYSNAFCFFSIFHAIRCSVFFFHLDTNILLNYFCFFFRLLLCSFVFIHGKHCYTQNQNVSIVSRKMFTFNIVFIWLYFLYFSFKTKKKKIKTSWALTIKCITSIENLFGPIHCVVFIFLSFGLAFARSFLIFHCMRTIYLTRYFML